MTKEEIMIEIVDIQRKLMNLLWYLEAIDSNTVNN